MRRVASGKKAAGFFLVIFCLFCLASALWAANEGPNFPVSVVDQSADPIVPLSDDQQNPTVIALPDKDLWFVVWEDWRNWSTTGSDIYGRFVDADGNLCGDVIEVCTAVGNQTAPTAAYRDGEQFSTQTDNIMVAWQDTTAANNYLSYCLINVSLLDDNCDGGSVGASAPISFNPIDSDSLISRKLPKVAYDGVRDQFWLVWVESRDQLQRIEEYAFGYVAFPWNFGDSNYVGYATVAAASGALGISDILRNVDSTTRTVRLISHSTSADEDVYTYEYFTDINNVVVACDDSSPETLIAWEGRRGRATMTCSYEDAPGQEAATGAGVPDANDNFFSEMVLDQWDGDDGLVHIYGIFDKNITQAVVHSLTIDASTKSCFYPALGFDTTHRKFLAAWEDRDARDGAGDGQHSKIFGRLIYSGGGLYGNDFAISFQDLDRDGNQDSTILNSNQTRPQISLDSTNQRFFVTWQDGRNTQVSLENLDIYGQFVDSEGSLRGNNYAVCVESANQYNPVTAFNPANHQFLTVWKDARNLNVTDSDIYAQRFTQGQPQLIILGDDGTQLIPPLLNFGSLETGQFASKTVTMANVGDTVLHIDAVSALASPFSYQSNLPSELLSEDGDTIDLLPGASLPLTIHFAPTASGVFISQFVIASEDATSLTVNLQGQAGTGSGQTDSNVVPSPTSISFGTVVLGEKSSRSLLLTNNGGTDANIVSTEISTGFSVTGLSGAVLADGGKLVGIVSFSPDQPRSYSGQLQIFYDDGSVSTVTLSGYGTGNVIVSLLKPDDVSFGNVPLGEQRSASLLFTNNGNVDLTITAFDLPEGVFAVSGLPGSIPAYGTLNAVVTFSPLLVQSYSATLRVLYNYGLAASEIDLSGSGIYDVNSSIDVPSSLSFPNTETGDSSTAILRLVNQGAMEIDVTAIDLPTGAFTVSGLPGTIPAQGVLDAVVTFSPMLVQSYSETMRLVYGQGVPAGEVVFSGSGIDLAHPALTVEPQGFAFGQVALGSTRTMTLVLTNTGNEALDLLAIDLPGQNFTVTGLATGTLTEGSSRVATITFAPEVTMNYSSTLRLVFGQGIAEQVIPLQGSGIEIELSPSTLNFPNCEVGSNTVLNVTINNASNQNLQVKGAVTGTDVYSLSGIKQGDIIPAYGSLICQVTFKPTDSGYFEDGLYTSIGPVQDMASISYADIDWGVPYMVKLTGTVNASFVVSEFETFTGDFDYGMSISASSNQPGQVFVIFSHDPLSNGEIYALTNQGLVAFPYEASFGWQNLWYLNGTAPGMKIDLSQVDMRPLGCSDCIGSKPEDNSKDIIFGGIIITPPDNSVFNNSTDFRYMPGTLYMATYVKSASVAGVFDFNQGLLEMQSLVINSLAGDWRVTSRYYDQDRIHSTLLTVTEENGQLGLSWPEFNRYQPTIAYRTDAPGYLIDFHIGDYHYTYTITELTEDSFSGTYTCVYKTGEVVALSQPMCGARAGSDLQCTLPSGSDYVNDDDSPTSGEVIATFSGIGDRYTQPFSTSGPWTIQWSTDDAIYGISVYNSDGTLELGNIGEQPGPGSGSSYQPIVGTFYLNVVASGNWNVTITSAE